MAIEKIISILDSMISAPLGLVYMILLSDGWRFTKKTVRRMIPVFIAVLFLADFLIARRLGGIQECKSVISILNIIACGCFYCSIYRYLDWRFLFSFFSACLFIFISDTISDCVLYSSAQAHIVVKLTVFLLIGFLIYMFFRVPFLEVFRELRHEWWWIATVPFSLCMVFAQIIMVPGPLYQNPDMKPAALFMCATIFFIYLAFYLMFLEFRKQHRLEESYHVLQTQIASLRSHADTIQELDRQVKMYRHDMRHYFHMVNICVENRDWDSIGRAMESMNSKLEAFSDANQLQIYSGEPLIDSVLSFFSRKARTDGIAYLVQLEAPWRERADITDFSVMLSNAVENAWNACREMPAEAKRCIKIAGGRLGTQYLLEIRNTYGKEVKFGRDGRPVSSREGHGYGTQSIADFAQRHKGYLSFEADGGWFQMRLILPEAGGADQKNV